MPSRRKTRDRCLPKVPRQDSNLRLRHRLYQMRLLNIAVNGNIVLTERIDDMVYDGNKISARCMGAFEVKDDKITAWRDYFDVP